MKISNLSKELIASINKYLKKNNLKPFLAKELKAIKEDALNVFFLHDELIIRGTLVERDGYLILALKSGLCKIDALVLDLKYKPVEIAENIDYWHEDLEEYFLK